MGSHQLNPRGKEEVRRLGPGLPSGMPGAEYYGVQQSAWVGWVNFAGVLLIMLGSFHVIQGLVALFRDEVYVVRSSGLVINVDYTTWGWVHLVLGAVAAVAGVCLLRSEEHTSDLQSRRDLVCRLLLEKKKKRENVADRYARGDTR